MNLQKQLKCRILTPLVVGVLITVSVSIGMLFYYYPTWINETQTRILTYKKSSALHISHSLSLAVEQELQNVMNNVFILKHWAQRVIKDEIKFEPTYTGYYTSIKKIMGGNVNLPGYS